MPNKDLTIEYRNFFQEIGMNSNNRVFLSGKITSKDEFDRNTTLIEVSCERKTLGVFDRIPVRVSSWQSSAFSVGDPAVILGELRTENYEDDTQKSHKLIYVSGQVILSKIPADWPEPFDTSMVWFYGNVCKLASKLKEVSRRGSISTRRLLEGTLAVNSDNTAYIPVVFWQNEAEMIHANVSERENIFLAGRLQSRVYKKKGDEDLAYEVSSIKAKKINKPPVVNQTAPTF